MASDRFVSRGGEKLQKAIDDFQLTINDKICLDVGSSTGGFVDCLLQNGAAKVYSVDTAYGELAWKLRNDPKVVVMERTSILHLDLLPGSDPENDKSDTVRHEKGSDPQVDLITIDAGWTKLELVLPEIKKFLKPQGQIIALLKPHYELRNKRGNLVRGVVPEELVEGIKEEVVREIKNLGFKVEKEMESPILGGAGNREYLLLLAV